MKTIALILGNNEYHEGAKLINAVNDSLAIRQVFGRLGFEIISKNDCTAEDFGNLLDEFERKIIDYDASIFYFAGHGFELDGENYLAAIDCQIPPANKYHAGQHSIRLNEILEIHRKNTDKVNIVIIDACRKGFERSGKIVLAPLFAPKGTLIAFSTSPNEGANDSGFEGHSIYTGALLNYIGREHLSVEELFKKVRKTVYAISEGRQTTWEHTSLINDYYFNTGQLIYSLSIPYDEKVVKDVYYNETGDFGNLIMEVKSHNWHKQNPAIERLLKIPPNELNKNQQFILGRNLLQASDSAHNAIRFMENIRAIITKYTSNNENHVLNGILFEIYFNAYGEFRKEKTKAYNIEPILALRNNVSLVNSFDFICRLLADTQYPLIYMPRSVDEYIDLDVVASEETRTSSRGETLKYQVISSITYNGVDITKKIAFYAVIGKNVEHLKKAAAEFFTAPYEIVHINCNLKLEKIAFIKSITEELDEW